MVAKKVITSIVYPILIAGIIIGLFSVVRAATNSNIDPTDKYAWSTNAGWINFNPTHGGVTVTADHLEGYAWGENIGWIRLGSHSGGGAFHYDNTTSTNYGVNRDASGNLSGYAWGTNVGWINFSPTHGGVTIDPTSGSFDGYAWGENIGWIHFKNASPAYNVVVDATAPDSSASCPDDYYNAGDIPVSWTASDASSGVGSTALWVKYESGGVWAGSGLTQTGISGVFSYTPNQGDGAYYFATVGTDNAGNVEATPSGPGDDSAVYDTTAPTARASSPGSTVEHSFIVSWSGNDATSGVDSYDVQYREGSAGTWQDWQSATTQTSATFGPTDPVTVEDEQTYHFRARAHDRAGNVGLYVAQEDSATYIGYSYVHVPLVVRNHPPIPVINGGFEDGWTGWTHGGELAQAVTSDDLRSGSFSARLGDPSYACNNVPVGYAWMEQSITVPGNGFTRLRVHYRIFSEDKFSSPEYDRFQILVNGEVKMIDGSLTPATGCAGPAKSEGWEEYTLDVTAYAGQTITVRFENWNAAPTSAKWYNTWTYVDDVALLP